MKKTFLRFLLNKDVSIKDIFKKYSLKKVYFMKKIGKMVF